MPLVLFESVRSQEVCEWWRSLPAGQRLMLLRSRLRDDARHRAIAPSRHRAIELGRSYTRQRLRSLRPARSRCREDPRHWGERDYCEYWSDRVPGIRKMSLYEIYRPGQAPNLLENIPEW
ncbi:hypothetical protein A7A76_04145 [Lysobacter enzymogenes]|uniref:hypothetical protein n=1 Tax=Lysobacter enzymogenes TaxID=69 RepID=UPI0019CFB3DD|nr:hypothetical protein [Lysobacter enzymogenes]MBN7138282.1 hypothetical protein [Lysobacter enzymogenes]